MSPDDLDRVFAQFSHALTRVGEGGASLVLARFALLAIIKLEDPELCLDLLKSAAEMTVSDR